MKKLEAYLKNTALLDEQLSYIRDAFPCFISREYVEMDFSQIVVICRDEDAYAIGTRLTAIAMLS